MSDALTKMTQSRRRILLDYREFAPMVLRLELEAVEDGDPRNPINTASVDGRTIRFAESFIDKLTDGQCDSLQMHECFHPALLHLMPQRIGNRRAVAIGINPDGSMTSVALSNIAQDHVINNFLKDAGFAELPGWACDPRFNGMAWEGVYDILLSEVPENQKVSYGPMDTHLPAEGQGETEGEKAADLDKQTKEWQKALADTLSLRKQAGKDSSAMEKLLTGCLDPIIPWSQVLADKVARTLGKNDYTWARPSRKGRAFDTYLPSMYSEVVECLVFCFDTSGSMWGDPLLDQAFSETLAALGSLNIRKAVLIEADVAVHVNREITGEAILDRNIKGGGGTSFCLALEAAAEYNPSLVIYFTDLEGEFPTSYDYPVLWVTANKTAKVPFGEVFITE